jgi:hypothetical protein
VRDLEVIRRNKDPEVRRAKARECMRKLRERDPEAARAKWRKYAAAARERKRAREEGADA